MASGLSGFTAPVLERIHHMFEDRSFAAIRISRDIGPAKFKKADQQHQSAALTAQRRFNKELNRKLVMRTPIDTGKARANWIASVGSPNNSFSADAPASKGKNYGMTIVQRNNRIIQTATLGQSCWMTNSVPYINRLEYEGHSRQAPAGWIRQTLIEMRGKYPYFFKDAFYSGSVSPEGGIVVGREVG